MRTYCKHRALINNQYLMCCGDLNGKELQKEEQSVHVPLTHCLYSRDQHNTVKQTYSDKNKLQKKSSARFPDPADAARLTSMSQMSELCDCSSYKLSVGSCYCKNQAKIFKSYMAYMVWPIFLSFLLQLFPWICFLDA